MTILIKNRFNNLSMDNLIINDYNKKSPKYERIEEYQVIMDSIESRLKQ